MSLLRPIALMLLATGAPFAAAQAVAPPPPVPVTLPAPDAPLSAPPQPPPPLALPRSAIPAIASPDPLLEGALRARLFDAAGRGPSGQPVDPDSTEWEQARAKGKRPDCAEVGPMRYIHTRVDLDGDAQLEALALVVGSYACGSRGCTLMIFRRTESGLLPVSELGLFQTPLVVVSQRHAGWLDLALPGAVSGAPDGAASGVVELRFDGTTYRPFPVPPPADPAAGPAEGTVVLQMDPVPFEQLGQQLPCAP
jgi:hypothetical protein